MSTNVLKTIVESSFEINSKSLRDFCVKNPMPVVENIGYEIKDENGTVLGKIAGKLSIQNDATASVQQNDDKANEEFDVFISYCWGEAPEYKTQKRVTNICNELEKRNFKCWFDQKQLIGNKLFGPICEGIKKSKLVLCCIDSGYCNSVNATSEFLYAQNNKKVIKPILFEPYDTLRQIPNNPVEFYLSNYLYATFYSEDKTKTNDDDDKEYIEKLAESIGSILNRNQYKTSDFNFNATEGKPIQLIKVENKLLKIIPEAINIIKDINGPIGIISIVGSSRSGKSYLLNRLLNVTKGFESHAGVGACTKGAWFWSGIQLHKNDKQEEMNLIIIDTEGFNQIDAEKEVDHKIFFLSVLISSEILYHTKNKIDDDSLSNLARICSMCEIQNLENETNNINSPSLIWVIRDFTLSHECKNDNEYLEKILSKENSITNDQKNNIDVITRWFIKNNRHCVALPPPTANTVMLKVLSQTDPTFLESNFDPKVKVLIKLATGIVTPHPNFDSGKTFITYLNKIVGILNSGNIINYQSIKMSVTESQIKSYKELVKKRIEEEKPNLGPIEPDELKNYIEKICQNEQKKLEKFANIDFQEINRKLKQEIEDTNTREIETKNKDYLITNWNRIRHRLFPNEERITTIEEFNKELECMINNYYSKGSITYGNQSLKEKILNDFYKTINKKEAEDYIKYAAIIKSTENEVKIQCSNLQEKVVNLTKKILNMPVFKITQTNLIIFPKGYWDSIILEEINKNCKSQNINMDYPKLIGKDDITELSKNNKLNHLLKGIEYIKIKLKLDKSKAK